MTGVQTCALPISDIALECGFSNTNTFILNFRQQYHITPGNYRRCYEKQASPQPQEGIAAISGTLSYMNLLKYAAKEEAVLPLNKRSTLPTRIEIDARENLGKLQLHHNDSTSLGWAEQLLHEEVRDAVRDSVKTIGFQSVLFFGIFDDSLDFYHEDKNGRQMCIRDSGTTKITDPAYEEAAKKIEELVSLGLVGKSALNTNASQAYEYLAAGQAGMLISGNWFFDEMVNKGYDNLDY